MIGERHQLIAYLATLSALVVCFLGAMVIGAFNETVLSKTEVFGLGTLVGGLIGVLKLPSQRNVTVDNPPSNPIPTIEEGPIDEKINTSSSRT